MARVSPIEMDFPVSSRFSEWDFVKQDIFGNLEIPMAMCKCSISGISRQALHRPGPGPDHRENPTTLANPQCPTIKWPSRQGSCR
jgi:hypothetical protein